MKSRVVRSRTRLMVVRTMVTRSRVKLRLRSSLRSVKGEVKVKVDVNGSGVNDEAKGDGMVLMGDIRGFNIKDYQVKGEVNGEIKGEVKGEVKEGEDDDKGAISRLRPRRVRSRVGR